MSALTVKATACAVIASTPITMSALATWLLLEHRPKRPGLVHRAAADRLGNTVALLTPPGSTRCDREDAREYAERERSSGHVEADVQKLAPEVPQLPLRVVEPSRRELRGEQKGDRREPAEGRPPHIQARAGCKLILKAPLETLEAVGVGAWVSEIAGWFAQQRHHGRSVFLVNDHINSLRAG
jgi:hypothetical protein